MDKQNNKKINRVFGSSLPEDDDKASSATEKNASEAGTTQKQATQKQIKTDLITTQNRLADTKFNVFSDKNYANKKVKTKKGKGGNVDGAAN